MLSGDAWHGPPAPLEPIALPADKTDPQPPPPDGPPRLAILLVFDQLRADYLTRWNDLFEEGGFHRLEREGTWFQNCNYPYALTVTGPGHASLATGCSPDRHGIVSNEAMVRYRPPIGPAPTVYCARLSPRSNQVPPVSGSPLTEHEENSRRRLQLTRWLHGPDAGRLAFKQATNRKRGTCRVPIGKGPQRALPPRRPEA